jgi:hypothetical protein
MVDDVDEEEEEEEDDNMLDEHARYNIYLICNY